MFVYLICSYLLQAFNYFEQLKESEDGWKLSIDCLTNISIKWVQSEFYMIFTIAVCLLKLANCDIQLNEIVWNQNDFISYSFKLNSFFKFLAHRECYEIKVSSFKCPMAETQRHCRRHRKMSCRQILLILMKKFKKLSTTFGQFLSTVIEKLSAIFEHFPATAMPNIRHVFSFVTEKPRERMHVE